MRQRLREARLWARRAGLRARQLQTRVTPTMKENQSYVTEADRTLERFLREKITRTYPEDGIIGEELTELRTEHPVRWVLDPIDGTASYAMQLPVWGVSIGLMKGRRPVGGVFWMPHLETEHYGLEQPSYGPPEPPSGSFHEEDLLCVPSDAHLLFSIDFPGKTRALGSTVFHMILVLQGRACGALLGRRHLWDLALGWGLSQNADVELVALSGEPVDIEALMAGKPSPEPLLFAHEAVSLRLRQMITEK